MTPTLLTPEAEETTEIILPFPEIATQEGYVQALRKVRDEMSTLLNQLEQRRIPEDVHQQIVTLVDNGYDYFYKITDLFPAEYTNDPYSLHDFRALHSMIDTMIQSRE